MGQHGPVEKQVLRLHRSERGLEACIPSGYSEDALIDAAQFIGPMKLRWAEVVACCKEDPKGNYL